MCTVAVVECGSSLRVFVKNRAPALVTARQRVAIILNSYFFSLVSRTVKVGARDGATKLGASNSHRRDADGPMRKRARLTMPDKAKVDKAKVVHKVTQRQLTDAQLAEAMNALRDAGYVRLDGVVAPEHLDALVAALRCGGGAV